MSTTVEDKNEIYLSTTRFPIKDKVRTALISTMPGKIVQGDYKLDDEPIASYWGINDVRGGILVEEMDEKVHLDRAWWSTCDLGYKGHIVLPPLATLLTAPADPVPSITNGNLDTWAGGNPTGWTETDGQTTEETTVVHTAEGSSGKQDTTTTPGHSVTITLDQNFACDISIEALINSVITISAYAYLQKNAGADTGQYPDEADLILRRNGADVKTTDCTSSEDTWTKFTTASYTVPDGTTSLTIRLYSKHTLPSDGGETKGGFTFWDDVTINITPPDNGTPTSMANFNSQTYVTYGKILGKLNAGETAFTWVRAFDSNIVKLVPYEDYMVIYMGDTDNAWSMDTDEAFTDSNATGAYYGLEWDSKVWKISKAGALLYSSDPESATPTWAANGTLNLPEGTIYNIFVYRDADMDEIIYVATTVGLYAHDTTNAKFLQTQCVLPNHPSGGKGVARWQDAAYITSGLDIRKYLAASTATIQFVGLDRDDGLPSEYRGEIVALVGQGYTKLYALVDSSLVTGTGYSGVYAYDGSGWQCLWLAATADDTMHCGIVSSEPTNYKLLFDHDSKVYSIPLQRDIQNPKKIATYTYGASGIHITPWFDGDWIGNKLALAITVFAKDTTADETIQVSYRTDHATTDIGSVGAGESWTSLGTLVAANDGVEKEYTFGTNAVGLEFKSIQFRFDLARGDTTTKSPDIQYAKFKFLKLLDSKWGWRVTLDLTEEYKHNSPKDLDAALKTIVETGTLVEFTFRDDTGTSHRHYVKVANCLGLEPTGEDYRNLYELELVAP